MIGGNSDLGDKHAACVTDWPDVSLGWACSGDINTGRGE